MAVIHIPEEEARKDFGAVLTRVDAGEHIVIDRNGSTIALHSEPGRGKTVAEALDILKARGNQPTGDESFADDLQFVMDRMRTPSNRRTSWD